MQVGERIKKYRNMRNITQEEIASNLDISQRAYSKIENNEVQIKLDRLQKIADLLDVDARLLLPEGNNQHFEKVTYSQISCDKVVNQISKKEQELYGAIIERQQTEIEYLKGIISVLKS
ncbi:helix-turn-helix domain-containing protein [Parvicella tangerina]|nr:helix-turn-helix transcriptional regulator [Parvicella tangerina]